MVHRTAPASLSTRWGKRHGLGVRNAMILSRLFRSGAPSRAIGLYRAIVIQARQTVFYSVHGVPDSVDGRYEMIALHVFLVLQQLKASGEGGLAQDLFDTMFADMDQSLREMGAGDLGVGRRVRAMAEGLYGRIAAYEAGLAGNDETLAAALRRNLYGTVSGPGPDGAALSALCRYVREAAALLRAQTAPALSAESLRFPSVPGSP